MTNYELIEGSKEKVRDQRLEVKKHFLAFSVWCQTGYEALPHNYELQMTNYELKTKRANQKQHQKVF